MKTARAKTPVHVTVQPVWCHFCCIRIAPYDVRTVRHGKDYHRDCYTKLSLRNGKLAK